MNIGDAKGEVCSRICEGIVEQKMTYAAFERVMNLPPKTVSNWRRGVSHSYLAMIPQISRLLHTTPDVLLGETEKAEAEWIEETRRLQEMYMRAKDLPRHRRLALCRTLEAVMKLYME